ncbi:hypothetical protein PHA63_02875 [Gordonia polyisoprenivorans]|nr:hypothetical protein [Gordonia polyisoprenivorans]WCB38116.1 hypothetical protein PHA63_02875 [Gordonia polyisoprenivorans]
MGTPQAGRHRHDQGADATGGGGDDERTEIDAVARHHGRDRRGEYEEERTGWSEAQRIDPEGDQRCTADQ